MTSATKTTNNDVKNKKYLTLVFSYDDCTKNSYDTVNNFLQNILSATESYNNHRPYTGSARYNLEEMFISKNKPEDIENTDKIQTGTV